MLVCCLMATVYNESVSARPFSTWRKYWRFEWNALEKKPHSHVFKLNWICLKSKEDLFKKNISHSSKIPQINHIFKPTETKNIYEAFKNGGAFDKINTNTKRVEIQFERKLLLIWEQLHSHRRYLNQRNNVCKIYEVKMARNGCRKIAKDLQRFLQDESLQLVNNMKQKMNEVDVDRESDIDSQKQSGTQHRSR